MEIIVFIYLTERDKAWNVATQIPYAQNGFKLLFGGECLILHPLQARNVFLST